MLNLLILFKSLFIDNFYFEIIRKFEYIKLFYFLKSQSHAK